MAMASKIQKLMMLAICLVSFGMAKTVANKAASKSMGPIFIFGDSTVDVGTNNYLKNCTARADHPYYGIDYPQSKATGRFSNGLNPADTIVSLLGGYNQSPPPFLALQKENSNFTGKLLQGVNFASGGSGLDKSIGEDPFGEVVSLEEQIRQFATVKGNITGLLGKSKGQLLLQNSMYIISIGSNDIMTYILTHHLPPELFIANLTNTYAIHLKNLYNLGARKFGIISVAPLGCCPIARSVSLTGDCAKEPNDLALAFYTPIESLLKNLSSTLDGFKYSLGNAYNMTMNILNKPIGFKDIKTACCGNYTAQGLGECDKGAHLCVNRDEYLFWDAFHPSQAAAKLAARALVFSRDPDFVTPINFGTLRMS